MSKKFTPIFIALLVVVNSPAATVSVGSWTPIFQGVDLADGRQEAEMAGEMVQAVLCLRIDLSDPDIKLFTTPKCTNCGSFETLAENTSRFLEQHGLQVAVNGAFYSSSLGPNDVPLGTPEDVLGLVMSRGRVVSPGNRADHAAAFLFTTNNLPIFIPTNSPPGTNTTGIYTAISGDRALLLNDVNLWASNPDDHEPRTALGLSQDRRHLFLLTVDGRQPPNGPGWSNGADFHDTAEWLRRFGASDGINVDGGGSTTMVLADCQGQAVRTNRSSYIAAYGRERVIGHNIGVYARPLPSGLTDLTVIPGNTTAIITWETEVESTTQVEYGPTIDYGNATALDPRLVKRHVATLSGLAQGSNYAFRAIATAGGGLSFTQGCSFATLRSIASTSLFALTNSWRYSTNNMDEEPLWTTRSYEDATWPGPSNGCLHIEGSTAPSGFTFPPRNTVLPPGFVTPTFRTYYFRTYFNFTGDTNGLFLSFSNYVDDGAVFYLNGAEVYRLRMPAASASIVNSTFATGLPCQGQSQVGSGDALSICPDVFSLTGDALTNLVQGENVLAVEVHNYTGSSDVLFGSAVLANLPSLIQPQLYLWREGDVATIFWNGEGFTLEQSSDLASPEHWSDVPGPVTQSPFIVPATNTMFYRLRQ